MKISVYGSAFKAADETNAKAARLGTALARHHAVVLTGACGGLPGIAAEAALKTGGRSIGFSPGRNKEEHDRWGFPDYGQELVFVPEDEKTAGHMAAAIKYRNVISCHESDAGIIIGGRIGTMNEFTILYDMGKVIGVLTGTGGSTKFIPQIVEDSGKDTGSVLIFEEDPEILAKKVIEAVENGKQR